MKLLPKISLYWKCQLLGWSAAALYWGLQGFLGSGFSWTLAILHFLADLSIYIGLSHLYRNVSIQWGWHQLAIRPLVGRLLPVVVLLGAAFMWLTVSKNYLLRYWFEPGFSMRYTEQLSAQWLVVMATGMRLMSIWLLAYYGYHFALREINAVKESSRLGMMAKDAAFNNLTAQLNPHFFFNALNSIKALVVENPQATRRAIDLLSDLLRRSLYRKEAGLISLQEEMDMVKDYLELEQIRLEKRLQTSLTIAEALLSQPLLPFSIQVLAENAIKHGIAHCKESGMLSIRVVQDGNSMRVEVQNPGKLQQAATHGLGIKNLQERLQLQYDGNASFRITQHTADTVLATLKIPLA
ncbi:sensor histidine kinase [Sediminibacterium goheungense]|uniref:Histidine kinase n=1 Tax=Sediminibacterium goheungense TaxID=1086393 RepID=A0A4R6J0X9_9BACT|nr:histidine kinase [Sediminibacterium goheungense]TDO28854.1 histidine kinase [Sediminibacterium goheungense]